MAYEQMGLYQRPSSSKRRIDLNEDFKAALEMMEGTSKNVLITGRAGTGKSTLLGHFRSITRKNAAVLAPTGVAALNVSGQTIHSFFRFRPDITPDTVRSLNRYQRQMYEKIDAIIIDEISMVRADLLDCVDIFMRLNGKDRSLPFGGVQVIFVGDLYQLPPVVTSNEAEMFRTHYKSEYFFDSHVFKGLKIKFIELRGNYRQTDATFIRLLNAIRENNLTDEDLAEINKRYQPFFNPGASEKYITLTTTNTLADSINDGHLARLPGPTHMYRAKADPAFDKKVLPADEELKIKVGMQVMLLNNDKGGQWVNGSIGEVNAVISGINNDIISVRLTSGLEVEILPNKWDLFKFSYDTKSTTLISKSAGSFIQYPIMPAWAVTIHKSQGKTFDKVVIDIGSGTFAHGQLYVALSRCTTLEGIVLRKKIEKKHIMMDQRIVDFIKAVQFGH